MQVKLVQNLLYLFEEYIGDIIRTYIKGLLN
jgi:hypothetical protein